MCAAKLMKLEYGCMSHVHSAVTAGPVPHDTSQDICSHPLCFPIAYPKSFLYILTTCSQVVTHTVSLPPWRSAWDFRESLELCKGSLQTASEFRCHRGEQLDEDVKHTPHFRRKLNKKSWPEQTDLKGHGDRVCS